MAEKKTNRTEEQVRSEPLFSREQLLAAKRFESRQDILSALLAPDKQYTVAAAEQMIANYMQTKVK